MVIYIIKRMTFVYEARVVETRHAVIHYKTRTTLVYEARVVERRDRGARQERWGAVFFHRLGGAGHRRATAGGRRTRASVVVSFRFAGRASLAWSVAPRVRLGAGPAARACRAARREQLGAACRSRPLRWNR